jgi:hypothetical protein
MPAYNATGVRVRLGYTRLSETVTQQIKLRKNEAAVNSEVTEKKVGESQLLSEKNVPFPGDADGLRVNFLKNVPFLQVKAGDELFKVVASDADWRGDPKGKSREIPFGTLPSNSSHGAGPYFRDTPNVTDTGFSSSIHRESSSSQTPDQDTSPKALVLHVTLSEKSFLPSFEDGKRQHLLIDVFFNGMLASSVLMHLRDIGIGVKSFDQIFAGTRAHNVAERPWVILPPAQYDDRNSPGRNYTVSSGNRWQEICTALLKEANERGFDKNDTRSPTGDYLESLASMEMPEQVNEMQLPGGRTFGIIDVVITAGNGKKTDQGYMWQPSRLRDGRYHKRQPEEILEIQQRDSNTYTDSERDAEGETYPDFVRTPQVSRQLRDITLLPSSGFPIQPPPSLMPAASSANTPTDFVSLRDLELSSGTNQQAGLDNSHRMPPAFRPSGMPFTMMQKVPNGLPAVPLSNSTNVLNGAPAFGVPRRGTFASTTSLARMPSLGELHNSDAYGPPPAHPFPPPHGPLPIFPLLGPAVCNGPFPAIGLFSVLPKLPCHPSRDPGIIDPDLPRSSFLLSRLVITGKLGRVLVDYHWNVPQRVALNWSRARPRNRSPQRKRRSSLDDEEYVESTRPHRSRAKRITATRLTTPPPTSPTRVNPDMTVSVDKRKGSTAHEGQLLQDSAKRPVPGPAFVYSTASTDHGTVNNRGGSLKTGTNAQVVSAEPIETSSARSSDHNPPDPFLGIHGSRVNPFTLDNPEGLIRHQAKLAHATTPNSISLAAAKGRVSNLLDFNSSVSSLSSAPATPELEAQRDDFSTTGELQLTKAAVPSSSNRPPHTPAPRLPASSRAQSVSAEPLVCAKTSAMEPPSEKQKRDYRRAFPWPDNTNPPLNQGCIIRFAEDGQDGKAPLRQIKTERQGVFMEDMVVVGMRYFVPG